LGLPPIADRGPNGERFSRSAISTLGRPRFRVGVGSQSHVLSSRGDSNDRVERLRSAEAA
jgi:hypothetical protein